MLGTSTIQGLATSSRRVKRYREENICFKACSLTLTLDQVSNMQNLLYRSKGTKLYWTDFAWFTDRPTGAKQYAHFSQMGIISKIYRNMAFSFQLLEFITKRRNWRFAYICLVLISISVLAGIAAVYANSKTCYALSYKIKKNWSYSTIPCLMDNTMRIMFFSFP